MPQTFHLGSISASTHSNSVAAVLPSSFVVYGDEWDGDSDSDHDDDE